MAQVTGSICDVCEKFSHKPAEEGWLQVKPMVQSGTGERSAFDVCGNACLIKLGRKRQQAAGERETRVQAGDLEQPLVPSVT